jgi:hypothetical protein
MLRYCTFGTRWHRFLRAMIELVRQRIRSAMMPPMGHSERSIRVVKPAMPVGPVELSARNPCTLTGLAQILPWVAQIAATFRIRAEYFFRPCHTAYMGQRQVLRSRGKLAHARNPSKWPKNRSHQKPSLNRLMLK